MYFRAAKSIYRWLLSLWGKRYLSKMLNDGLPVRFENPLHYLLTKKLKKTDKAVVNIVESIRSEMASFDDLFVDIVPSPRPGSSGKVYSREIKPKPGEIKKVPLSLIANTTSVLPYWGTFLYLCANANRSKTILELGGCAGISGCYMASSRYCEKFMTVEGSEDLAKLAESNLRRISDNFSVVNTLFDKALDDILPELEANLDMVYIDGQHEKLATFHYLERLIPHLSEGCIVVFDDIHWTPDMEEAWQALGKWEGITLTLDVGRFGLCLRDSNAQKPKNYDFSRFTDLWRKGKPQN